MSYAGHLPTKHFTLAEWQAMPIAPADPGIWPGEGFRRASCRGRPIVFYVAPLDSGEVDFAVRPIVRVKMGRGIPSGQFNRIPSRLGGLREYDGIGDWSAF